MNSLILILLLSLSQVGADPIKETAEEANDPTIAHLIQTLNTLNELLTDQVGRTRHPESSTVIKKLREKIVRTEAAIEERKATRADHHAAVGLL